MEKKAAEKKAAENRAAEEEIKRYKELIRQMSEPLYEKECVMLADQECPMMLAKKAQDTGTLMLEYTEEKKDDEEAKK